MLIGNDQVVAFERLSSDSNPLHVDPVHARSTPFGRPVVYGMCAVLIGLARWAEGRSFQIVSIRGRFGKPLFEGEPYDLEITEAAAKVRLEFLKGSTVQTSVSFRWDDYSCDGRRDYSVESRFQPVPFAHDNDLTAALERWEDRRVPYSIRTDVAAALLPEFGLRPGQIPLDQLNALLGSSYFVGMELPGRRALYTGFEFQFERDRGARPAQGFEFHLSLPERDERLNRFSIRGRGTGIQSFCLTAYQRPDPVRYDIEHIRAAVGESAAFKDKVVFVSGAARGFGSVVSQMFALQGATVILNYRSNREDAERIAREITSRNRTACCLAADVASPTGCRKLREEITHRFGRVDILIANAFPHIPTKAFLDQSPAEFSEFLQASVSTCVPLIYELLPLVPKGGMVMEISTIYTRRPKAQFAHYIAAKSAVEGLMRALAAEFEDRRFVVVRPPRMLTDQTNVTFDLSPAVSAIEVGRRLLDALREADPAHNLAELDL